MYWYSSYSTGIMEVDSQHSNIDMLLVSCIVSKDNNEEKLDTLRTAIEMHFQFEQDLIGDSFPESHREEHTQFLADLDGIIDRCKKGVCTVSEFAEIMQLKLVNHVHEFDSHLKEYLPE